MARPKFWLLFSQPVWNKDDTTTNFVGVIYRNEEMTLKKNLDGIVPRIIISTDYPYAERNVKEVNVHNQTTKRGEFHVKFDSAAVDTIGEWKVEVRLWENGSPIGITHHSDFEVVA